MDTLLPILVVVIFIFMPTILSIFKVKDETRSQRYVRRYNNRKHSTGYKIGTFIGSLTK